MDFTTTRSNLLHVIQTVYRVSSLKATLPILGCILFKVSEDNLTATSTDIDLTIQCIIPVNVLKTGAACLPARQITDIARCLPDTVLRIENNAEINSTKISYDDSQLNIKGYPPEQFPALPEVTEYISLAVTQGVFKEMIKQTVYAVSADKARPLFTGVLFEKQDQKLRLVATDTHRLAYRETLVEDDLPASPARFAVGGQQAGAGQAYNIIVPGSALAELNRIMRDPEEKVTIKISKNHAFFTTKDTLLISRLIAGQFPAYRQIIPVNFSSCLVGNTEELTSAVARASLLIDEEMPVLRLNLSPAESLISVSTSSGWIKEKLRVNYQGEEMEIFFNARYLIDVLRVIPTEETTINFTGPLSAVIIQPIGGDDYLSLLLPARPKSD